MYELDIRNLNLKAAKSIAIPGFRRHVLYSEQEYGLLVGDFNSRVKFGFVVYKPGYCSSAKIRIELKVLASEDGNHWRLKDIDPAFIKSLLETEGVDVKFNFIIENGVGYFQGLWSDTSCGRIPDDIVCSNLGRFLNVYGDALATVLAKKGNVNTLKDALEVNDLLISVNAFVREMQPKAYRWGTATYNKESAQESCNKLRDEIAQVEDEMNSVFRKAQVDKEALAKYGIDESDIDFS